MRKIILIALCFLLLSPIVYAQQNIQAELQNLNRRIPALIEQEDFDEVVAVALEHDGQLEVEGAVDGLAAAGGAVAHGLAGDALQLDADEGHGGEHVALRQADLDVHPRVAMQILRHARFSITMEIYTQVSSTAIREALKRLGERLDGLS